MVASQATLDWIRRIKEKHEASLLSKKNNRPDGAHRLGAEKTAHERGQCQ
jgi:hypothetical protein